MEEIIKKKLKLLGWMIFHISIPMTIIFLILNIWDSSISNTASMDWNIFITIACLGCANLVIMISLFIHFIKYVYYEKPFK